MHGESIEDSEKKYIVTNINFEAIIPPIKMYCFRQRMVDFVNKLKLIDRKYQTNGNVRDENYKRGLLFPMKDFVSFITYHQSIYFMSTIFLKDKINRPVFHSFNFLTFTTQIILHIKIWLICVMNYIICGGGINIWNYMTVGLH